MSEPGEVNVTVPARSRSDACAAVLASVDALHAAHDLAALARITVEQLPSIGLAMPAALIWFEAPHTAACGWNRDGTVAPQAIGELRLLLDEQLRRTSTGVIRTPADGPIADALRAVSHPAAGAELAPLSAIPVASGSTVTGMLVLAGDPDEAGISDDTLSSLGRVLGHVAATLPAAADALSHTAAAGPDTRPDDLEIIVRSIADALNVAVLFYDTDNQPRLHNRMVEKLLALAGYDPATGKSMHVYASDRHTPVKRDKNIVSETLEGDQRGVIYWMGDPDDGQQRAVVTEAHRIRRPDGTPLGSAVMTYDITDLADAIDAREEYLTTVSHELRTPLTAIVGYLDLIADSHDVATAGFSREFQIIKRNADQLARLVQDLTSTDSRGQRLRIEPVDLTALVRQAVTTARPMIDAAGHSLHTELPGSALLGRADATRLSQAIDNLVSNAVKYTPRGGTIGVSLVQDGTDALLRVSDTGRGITRSDQARVFDRFFRADEVREAAIDGVGIGLSIVKNIVDGHGGTITVTSEPGHGTTFSVRLPLHPHGAPLPTVADRL